VLAAQAVPPPTSTTMCARRSIGSMPHASAPAIGSSIAAARCIPASSAAASSARRSSAVAPEGTPIATRPCMRFQGLDTARRATARR